MTDPVFQKPAYFRAIEKFNTLNITEMALVIFAMEAELGRTPRVFDVVGPNAVVSNFISQMQSLIEHHKFLFTCLMEKSMLEIKTLCHERCQQMTAASAYANLLTN